MLTRCLDVAPSSRLPLNGSGCSFSTLLTRSPPARRGAADLRSVAHPLLRSARNTVLRSWCGDRQTTKLSSFSRHRHHHSPSRRGFGPNASRESISNVSGDCALANLRSLQLNQHCAVDSIARETRPSMPTWSTDARTCSAPSTMPETRHAKNIPAREFQRSSPTRSRHPAQSNSGVGCECRIRNLGSTPSLWTGDRRDDHRDRSRAHANEVELFGVEAPRVGRLGNGSARGARNPPCARGGIGTGSLPPMFSARRARWIRRPPPLSTPRGIGPRIENRTSRDGSAKAPAVERATHAISPCGRGIVAASAGRDARRVRSAGDRGKQRISRDPSGVQGFASDGAAAYAAKRSRAAYGMRRARVRAFGRTSSARERRRARASPESRRGNATGDRRRIFEHARRTAQSFDCYGTTGVNSPRRCRRG